MATTAGVLERWFRLDEHGTTVRTEVLAGLTTFLTMAYIIAVNPAFLSVTGMDRGALVTATCLAAGLSTLLMGLYANLPLALASGMGLNAFFAFSVCGALKVPWQTALAAVFVEGLIFILLTLTRVRELVVDAIPLGLKVGVSAGIGFFIAFIGLENAKLVVADPATLVTLGSFADPRVVVCLAGLVVTAVLVQRAVRGAILGGIATSTLLAWGWAWYVGADRAAAVGIALPSGAVSLESIAPIAGQLSFGGIDVWGFMAIVVTLLFVDFFDTVGTLVGVATKAGMLDEKGRFPGARAALLVDAVGTTLGALLGVSTVTTYVESAAGVAEGGRTGLTAVTVALLFFAAMFFAPVFIAIPGCATAPALIVVGYFMTQNLCTLDLHDAGEALPAFLAMVTMPLTYSIATGLMFGILSYAVFNALAGHGARVSWTMRILALIFLARILSQAL